jgi:hypothetical protein
VSRHWHARAMLTMSFTQNSTNPRAILPSVVRRGKEHLIVKLSECWCLVCQCHQPSGTQVRYCALYHLAVASCCAASTTGRPAGCSYSTAALPGGATCHCPISSWDFALNMSSCLRKVPFLDPDRHCRLSNIHPVGSRLLQHQIPE